MTTTEQERDVVQQLHTAIATVQKLQNKAELDRWKHWMMVHPMSMMWLSMLVAIMLQTVMVAVAEMAEFSPHIEELRFDFSP